MNELATQPLRHAQGEAVTRLLPVAPRREVSIRVATMADLPFLDAMQKKHGRALGYFPTKQFEGYIEMGAVLVAWASSPCSSAEIQDTGWKPVPLGYCISRDRYLKRDELGVIYQLCVAPGDQRKLIGATLVREVFNRSAYGCRLYCCWCAQDLDANYFWESLGFVPIAFRGGSSGKKRVHIFWQRRIREGDATTPWWFPAKTESGAMREDRLVLPIPPGLRWSDEMPVLSAFEGPVLKSSGSGETPGSTQLAAGTPRRAGKLEIGAKGGPLPPTPRPRAGVQFRPPGAKPVVIEQPMVETNPKRACPEQSRRAAKRKVTIDPAMVAKARELRDRYLERVNDSLALLPASGKYDVSRALEANPAVLNRLVG